MLLLLGIIKDVNDHHKNARVTTDPARFERQIKLFYDFAPFKKLGVMYEDTINGRSYAGLDQVERASKILGIEIVRCHTLDEGKTNVQKEREESVVKCLDYLTGKIDALFLTERWWSKH